MRRFFQAVSDLKLSAVRSDLSTSFEEDYMAVCKVRMMLNTAHSLEDDISEEDAAYLREKLARAEEQAAEKARRRHEQVKRAFGVVAEWARVFRRPWLPLN